MMADTDISAGRGETDMGQDIQKSRQNEDIDLDNTNQYSQTQNAAHIPVGTTTEKSENAPAGVLRTPETMRRLNRELEEERPCQASD